LVSDINHRVSSGLLLKIYFLVQREKIKFKKKHKRKNNYLGNQVSLASANKSKFKPTGGLAITENAWQLNIKELWCYSDSETAIKLIWKPVDEWHHYAAILLNIKNIIAREWRVNIDHTFQEGNSCVLKIYFESD
jgi:hypothetical protein